MFQINSLFLQKFGWTMNMWSKDIPYTFTSNRIYGILYEDDKVYFVKSFDTNEIKGYKLNNYYGTSSTLRQNIEEKVEIKSNVEMVIEIKKNDACIKEYQRHFKLSSILKK
jgi:hypothetical protein